jgi:DNA-binding GntR family transcriptional regulator
MSTPVFRHRNLPESLADHIVTLIATRQLSPGQRLFENEMCTQLGVSRIPIREALRILQAQGVVRTEPNRGTFIAEFGSQEMLEMLEVRLVVEKAALRRMLALAKLQPSIFDQLQVHIEAMHQAARISDRLAYSEADLAFHNGIVAASGSPMLKPIWDSLSRDVFVFLMQEREEGYDFKRSAREHESLLEVLRSGDAGRIEEEIEQHIWGTTRARLSEGQPVRTQQRRRSPATRAKPAKGK